MLESSPLHDIDHDIVETLKQVQITINGIDMDKPQLKVPSSTWTYLIDDSPEQMDIMPIQTNPIAAAFGMQFFNFPMILRALFKKIKGKKKKIL